MISKQSQLLAASTLTNKVEPIIARWNRQLSHDALSFSLHLHPVHFQRVA
jgi:hypothetical protein